MSSSRLVLPAHLLSTVEIIRYDFDGGLLTLNLIVIKKKYRNNGFGTKIVNWFLNRPEIENVYVPFCDNLSFWRRFSEQSVDMNLNRHSISMLLANKK
jgi:hypothetical protein